MTEKRQAKWTIADVIDFETLIREDEGGDAAERSNLKQRDRSIYKEIEKEDPGEEALASRRFLFHRWLDYRRKELFGRGDTPGEEVESLFKFLSFCLAGLGLIFAFGIVQGFFSGSLGRTGEANPVPVVAMAVVCVIIPFLLTLYGFWVALGSRLPRELPNLPPFLRGFWIRVASPMLRSIGRRFTKHSGAESRLQANAFAGDVRALATSRRGVFAAYFLLWMQCLSLGYAVGLPVSIAWKNSTTSRDYGWSTNYDEAITPERINGFARFLALPWSAWRGAGEGYPSLEQVRASQYERYDPATSENSEVWGVWASFLLLASLFYVSVPRFALFFLSRANLQKALNTEPFEERFSLLYERLTEPVVDVGPDEEEAEIEEVNSNQNKQPSATRKTQITPQDPNACVVIMSEDLDSDAFRAAVRDHLEQKKRWSVSSSHRVPEDAAGRHQFTEKVPSLLQESGSSRLVIVEDVYTQANRQQMNYLKNLRDSLGRQPGIVVAFFADDEEDPESPLGGKLPEVEFEVWSQKLKALGDPNLRVIAFHPSST